MNTIANTECKENTPKQYQGKVRGPVVFIWGCKIGVSRAVTSAFIACHLAVKNINCLPSGTNDIFSTVFPG